MSTATASGDLNEAKGPSDPGGWRAPRTLGELASGPTAPIVALGAGVALVLLALAHEWLYRQFFVLSRVYISDWGHSYAVPLISIYYIWRNRERLSSVPVGVFWPGLGVVALGAATYIYFVVGFSNHMLQGFSLVLLVAGAVLFLLGARAFRSLCFPIAYLAVGVTIAQMLMERVTFQLKLFASVGSHALLNLVGVDNDLFGNVLHIYQGTEVHELNVADACSGMRMVVAFIALAVFVAFLYGRLWWQRIFILMLAIPVAIFMNMIRVAVLSVLTLIDPELAAGDAHTFIGTLLLIPALALFLGVVWAAERITPEPESEPGGTTP